MNRALLQQALDALENINGEIHIGGYADGFTHVWEESDAAIEALRAELEKPQPEPVGYVNSDELDNMLEDRDATLSPTKTGWYTRPLYAAPTEPNCRFPTCHSQECQEKLVHEILEPKLPPLFSNLEWLGNKVRVHVFQRQADKTPINVHSSTHDIPEGKE